MSNDDAIISPTLPDLNERKRDTLYLPDGREITIRKPMGFARHPECVKADRDNVREGR